MHVLPFFVIYACLVAFVVAVIGRIIMWSRMPMHVRWELYPVAHEGGGRAAYGGSYLENSEWWAKKREVSLLGELKVMVPEILFLVALREHNRKLWTRSFPFHFGLYLVALTTVLMAAGGLVAPLAPLVARVVPVTGAAGLVLGILGAIGLFLRRRSAELVDYTAPADLFNLVFFVVAFGTALVSLLLVDRDLASAQLLVQKLVAFQPVAGPALPLVSAVLLALLTAYIPLTHMSHFVGKYFAFHAIRWSDEPNLRGGKDEPVIHRQLDQPLSWSAAHIASDGTKTWLEAATEEIKK